MYPFFLVYFLEAVPTRNPERFQVAKPSGFRFLTRKTKRALLSPPHDGDRKARDHVRAQAVAHNTSVLRKCDESKSTQTCGACETCNQNSNREKEESPTIKV